MKFKQHNCFTWCTPVLGLVLLAVTVLLYFSTPAHSFQFEYGDLQGNLDTTLSYGLSWRVEKRDSDLVGIASGGNAYSVNGDDGNLNYDRGLVSNVSKITSELELNYQNFSAFIRGTAFYDFENERSSRDRISLTGEALNLVGSDIDLLDAYIQVISPFSTAPFRSGLGNRFSAGVKAPSSKTALIQSIQ
ncbi:MAG: DUF1302 family protein [Thermoplasmata archaeon]|nr:DUF1302 family protein [Thermoplasmata archaeon]